MRRMRFRDRLVVTLFAVGIVCVFVGLAFVAGYVLGRVLL
jgi:hypothetical protein